MATHRIYVIELRNYKKPPHGRLPWIYVGETTKTVQERFEQHRRGVNSNIKPYVWRLRPDLAGNATAAGLLEARRLERRTAKRCRNVGYSVRTDVELQALGAWAGRCPVCRGEVVVTSSGCECGATECDFRVSDEKGGRIIPFRRMRQVLKDGRTEKPVEGFLDKSEKRFAAHVVLRQRDGKWDLALERI